jgi:opacity protein-like surface antigen
MDRTNGKRISKMIFGAALALVLVGGAMTARAEDRAERWELALGPMYQLGADLDFDGGSTVSTRDDWGFSLLGGYNFDEHLATTFGFQWTGIGYNANLIQDDGSAVAARGSYDTWAITGNVVYNVFEGAITPYIGAGLGWTWIDTNIPTGPPITGCWWDPWWGPVCYTSYPTKTTDAFSYQVSLGVRWDFNYSAFGRLSYTSQWQQLGKANGTPRFDVIGLEIGFKF